MTSASKLVYLACHQIYQFRDMPHQPWLCSSKLSCVWFAERAGNEKACLLSERCRHPLKWRKGQNTILESSVSFLNTKHMFPALLISFQCQQKLRANRSLAFSVCKIYLFCSTKEVLVSWKRWLWSLLKSTSIDHNVCRTQRANYGCQRDKQFWHFLKFEKLSYDLNILFCKQFLSVSWGFFVCCCFYNAKKTLVILLCLLHYSSAGLAVLYQPSIPILRGIDREMNEPSNVGILEPHNTWLNTLTHLENIGSCLTGNIAEITHLFVFVGLYFPGVQLVIEQTNLNVPF